MLRRAKFWAWFGVAIVGLGLIVFLIGPTLFASVAFPLPAKYQGSLSKWSLEYDLSPNFMAALIYTESTWNPNAQSGSGAEGLTQIIRSTCKSIAQRLNDTCNAGELKTNTDKAIRYGAFYISDAIDRYGGDKHLALVAYNGGGGAANALRAGFPVPGTVRYANTIESRERAYDSIYGHWWERSDLPDLSARPKGTLDLLPSINVVDFWKNLLFTASDLPSTSPDQTSSPDVNNFWKSILPGS